MPKRNIFGLKLKIDDDPKSGADQSKLLAHTETKALLTKSNAAYVRNPLHPYPQSYKTHHIDLIRGYFPNPHPGSSNECEAHAYCKKKDEGEECKVTEELYKTNWVDWAYTLCLPTIEVTPSPPMKPTSPEPVPDVRCLGPRDADALALRDKMREEPLQRRRASAGEVLEEKGKKEGELPKLSLDCGLLFGRRKKKLGESGKMTEKSMEKEKREDWDRC